MPRELSTRQKKFIQAKLEGKSNAQAARDAGYSESVANIAGKKILSHPAVQARLQHLMERAGLTDERLSRAIQGPDLERVAQIGRLAPHVRRIIQSLILALASDQTDEALRCLRSLRCNVQPPKRRGITMAELQRKFQMIFPQSE
jgi:hypothetical protein